MALAAVCPSCSTRFRVVADQLKLKNGWVRCGSCGFAFNAVERLSYVPDDTIVTRRSALDELIAKTKREEAAVDQPPAPVPQDRVQPAAPMSAPAEPNVQAALEQSAAQVTAKSAIQAREEAAALAWPHLDQTPEADAPAPVEAAAAPEPPAKTPPPPPPAAAPPAKPRTAKSAPPQDDDPYELHTIIELAPRTDGGEEPIGKNRFNPAEELAAEFLERDAQAAARAQRIARVAGYGSLLLGLLLIGQLSLTFRNEVAAAAPGARPMLQFACEHLGCTVELPAHASRLSLESLQLAQIGSSDVYQATVLIKNTSALTQRPPHLELTLTRVNGDILARRVFAPKEWLPAQANVNGLAPLGETVAQFALRVDNASLGAGALSGFGGALFYPAP